MHPKAANYNVIDQQADLFSPSEPLDNFGPMERSSPFLLPAYAGFLGWSGASAVAAHPSGLASPTIAAPGLVPAGPAVVISTPGSGLVFNNTYSSGCTAQYEACIVAAEKQLESLFTNSDTINVDFNEATEGPGYALTNSSNGNFYSFAQVKAALLNAAPGDVLPAIDPSGGSTKWYVPEAYGRMLGLTATTGSPDLSVTLNTFYSWDFGQDVINGLIHELSEGGMGRIGDLGGGGTGEWGTMDLFRYNAAGQPDYSNGRDGDTTYFSPNGGSTLSDQGLPGKGAPTLSYNNQYNSDGTLANTNDTADWVQNNVFGSTGDGETLAMTQTELQVLEALGWKLSLKQNVDSVVGNWETPNAWSTGSMPIEPQDVYISSAGIALDSNVIVNSIATASNSVLGIGDSTATTLTAVDGTTLNTETTSFTATGNDGEIAVHTNSALQIGYLDETFFNAGSVLLGMGARGSGAGDLDIAGEINLNGAGTLTLGQNGNFGNILNAPGTSGDSLLNVNNTISGSGLISLDNTFDNQSGGVLESQGDLQISALAFTNEGAIIDEAGARLDLGQDDATQSLDNTGVVNIAAASDLAISGNYTLNGGGSLAFKGAGAKITSDGTAATFTNASTIEAEISGQIGDKNLTFINAGIVAASGSGVTLTIDSGENTILNSGTIASASSSTVTIASNVTNQGTLEAGSSQSSRTTTGTLDLGLDGSTAAANNTGLILVTPGSDLAISGNYTVSSGGNIYLDGGGAMTSDGNAPATFTNASTIDAVGSVQIGDVGIKANDDLTFVNTGSVIATLSGTELTINTGTNAINDSSGSLEAVNSANLRIDSSVNTGKTGTIEASSGGTVLVLGALSGSGTLSAAVGGVIDLAGGGSFAGAITGAGTVLITSPITLDAGASLSAANVVESYSLTLANAKITNSAADTFVMTTSSGSSITLGRTGSGSFTNAGNLIANGAGTAQIKAPFTNSGTVSALAGTMTFLTAISGTGILDLAASATVSLGLGAASGQTVDFLGTTGALDLSNPIDFTGKINDFGHSDKIFLEKANFSSFSFNNNLLTVFDGSTTAASLNISETSNQFTLKSESHGVLITFN